MIPISLFDAHCDTLSCCAHMGRHMAENMGHVDLKRGKEFEHYAQVFAIYRDPAKLLPEQMFPEFEYQAKIFKEELAQNQDCLCHCKTAEDLERAEAAHKIAAILSVEGADLLECDPNRLDAASDLGVKLINLTWNRANRISGTNVEERDRGLSEQGTAFVRRAQKLGILMDVSHLSDAGFWDLVRITEKPIVASHSNSRRLCDHTRNLTDDMFKAIRDTGGFVGINFYSAFVGRDNSIDAIFAHLEHFLEMDGEQVVGFGADWDGCLDTPDGIRGIQDMPRIYDKMLQRNYKEELIRNIFYRNLKRTIFGR